MTRIYNRELRKVGMGISQLGVLASLRQAGPSLLGTLAASLGIERTTLLRNVSLLRRRGWVRWNRKTGRQQRVAITSTGSSVLKRALPRWDRAQDRVSRMLGPARVAAILRLLEGSLARITCSGAP